MMIMVGHVAHYQRSEMLDFDFLDFVGIYEKCDDLLTKLIKAGRRNV